MDEVRFITSENLKQAFAIMKSNFVAKEDGKGLSTEDYTTVDMRKLAGIEVGAEVNVIDTITLNGNEITVKNKNVEIIVDASETNGNIKVGNQEVEVYALPKATDKVNGGVTIGCNISNDNGEISITKLNITDALGFEPMTPLEVKSAIENAKHLKRKKVEALPPVEEADEDTIYMLLADSTSEDNKYEKWIVLDGAWENLGTTSVALEGYVKSENLVALTTEEVGDLFVNA